MKKTNLIFSLCTAIVFLLLYGCKDPECDGYEETPYFSQFVEGKWRIKNIYFKATYVNGTYLNILSGDTLQVEMSYTPEKPVELEFTRDWHPWAYLDFRHQYIALISPIITLFCQYIWSIYL